jgi:hypothetical protein
MQSYDTVTEALAGLKEKGYTTDFNIEFDKLICSKKETILTPDEFEIVEVYRFEGETDPGDENVVYAVEAKQGNVKGVFTSAFGTYADSISNDMVKKLSMHKN